MQFRVFELYGFKKRLRKLLSQQELQAYERFKKELKRGNLFGKPLSFRFLREQKIGVKRIYFLVYYEIRIILFVDSSDKKAQKETVNKLKELLPEFKNLAYKLSRKKK